MSYAFFRVMPQRLNFIWWRFGTLCSIFIGAYEDGTECSETSAYKFQTPENYPEESIQQYKTQYIPVHILPKYPHNCQNTQHYKTHTYTHAYITKPIHTHILQNPHIHTPTHTLQNPHIHTRIHYKTHTYTHPHITKHTPIHYKIS